MTDFALYHKGTWRDGELPKISGATYVVNYDQRNRAYHIQKDEYDEFIEWVAQNWEIDRTPREDNEDAGDYLERIDVLVREI